MISYHYTKNWRALLLALPLLLGSLTGQASEYNISFGPLAEGSSTLVSPNGVTMWTYTTSGTVSNLGYSADKDALSFFLSPSSVAQSSLTLTSSHAFTGKIMGIVVQCNDASGLILKAYAGQTELGELVYDGQKTFDYRISQLSYTMQSEPLSLKFIAGSGETSGVSVSGLRRVTVYIDDAVAPLHNDVLVSFDPADLSSAVLSNYSYKGILFTLNESNADGFEDEEGEGVIYIGSLLTDAAVDGVNKAVDDHSYSPGDGGYATDFAGGITLMVGKGKGVIKIEAENEADYAYHVKIGDKAPVEVSSTTRQWLEVPYQVDKDTYVYIYMVQKTSAVRASTRIGRRGRAYGKIYYAKCAIAPPVPGDATGNGLVDWNDVKAIVDYIMGMPPAGFNMALANVNGDSVVNAADLVEVIQIVKEHTTAE